jgi:allophanate hydrolase
VVPAVAGLDCVSVLARSVGLAAAALALAAGPDADDPWSLTPPPSTPVVDGGRLRMGIARNLPSDPAEPAERARPTGLDGPGAAAWAEAVTTLDALGSLVEIDVDPYLDAGTLLYTGAFVAARWAAFGQFLTDHPEGGDPTVASIVGRGRELPAHHLVSDLGRLRSLAAKFAEVWSDVDVVAVPTVGMAPTIAGVAADPIGINAALGRWTSGTNLLDLCAAAVPCGWRSDGVPFSVMFLGPAWADPVVAAAGARLLGEPDPAPPPWVGWSTIVVVGAHLSGQPLNRELTRRAARLVRRVATAPSYRLFALPTDPPKPGLVRVSPTAEGSGAEVSGPGVSVEGELWTMPLAGFGDFVRHVPPPLTIGTVALSDGSQHPGFLCEPIGLEGAPDISAYGGWLAYREGGAGAR